MLIIFGYGLLKLISMRKQYSTLVDETDPDYE